MSEQNEAEQPVAEAKPDVWHVAWNGHRQVILHRLFGEHQKAVVEFRWSLELVDSREVFTTEAQAYTSAWLRGMEKAGEKMKEAGQYKERADKLRAEAGK